MGVFPSRLHRSAVPCVHLTLASSEFFFERMGAAVPATAALKAPTATSNGFLEEKGKEKASAIESGMCPGEGSRGWRLPPLPINSAFGLQHHSASWRSFRDGWRNELCFFPVSTKAIRMLHCWDRNSQQIEGTDQRKLICRKGKRGLRGHGSGFDLKLGPTTPHGRNSVRTLFQLR